MKLPTGGVSHQLGKPANGMQGGGAVMIQSIEYNTDCEVASFGMSTGAGDYWLQMVNQNIDTSTGLVMVSQYCQLRFIISGGFERNYPRTTQAIAELYRAMRADCEALEEKKK